MIVRDGTATRKLGSEMEDGAYLDLTVWNQLRCVVRHLNQSGANMGSWAEDEIAECELGDARLNRRLGTTLEALGERPGKSLPTAFQDWANTKAAYRFFANDNVS